MSTANSRLKKTIGIFKSTPERRAAARQIERIRAKRRARKARKKARS